MMKKIITILALFSTINLSNAQSWSPVGTGMDEWVRTIAEYNGDLYAGGDFLFAGGNFANYLARWDGVNWSSVGSLSGVNTSSGNITRVWALAVYNNELYAGGNFKYANGITVNGIAKWDGTNWSALGTGLGSGVVRDMTVYNGELYIGGGFTTIDGIAADYIAKWNGSNWSSVGTGVNHTVWALKVSNGELYVGGDFSTAGGLTVNNIAKWDGMAWTAMGSGLGTSNQVFAIEEFNGEIFAGGNFGTWVGAPVNYISKWNGSNWTSVGSSFTGDIRAMKVYNDKLYVGGELTVGGYNAIARWDGNSWNSVNGGLTGNFGGNQPSVYGLETYNNELYAGGNFTLADGNPANFIAKWTECTLPTLTTTTTNPLCHGGTGTATVTPTGNAPFTYNWSNGQTTQTATGLPAGTHTVTVTDDSSCAAVATVTITEPAAIISNISSTPTNYNSPNCNGSVEINPSGGTLPYSIYWSSGTTNNLCQGWYTATITDANNCVVTDSVYVNFVTGMEELNAAGISVYPNPVNDVLFIKSDNGEIGELKIYDMIGQLIHKEFYKDNSVDLNLIAFTPGIYILNINNYRIKLIKE